MKKLLFFGSAMVLLLAFTGTSALAAPKDTCDGPISGSHGSLTVTGACTVTDDLTINGNLTLADGSVLAAAGSEVHVTGNIKVGKGAQLLLGWNAPEGKVGPDVVDGNIVANQPLALYIGNVTVHGNVVSNGGGSADRFYNFPIKDNVIDGNLVIHGWTGGWWGVIANTVGGNVDLSHNQSVVHPADDSACEGTFPAGCDAAPGPDPDAAEVQSRSISDVVDNPQHISGNLICHANTPAAQVNPIDGGGANIVDGKAIGECSGLVD